MFDWVVQYVVDMFDVFVFVFEGVVSIYVEFDEIVGQEVVELCVKGVIVGFLMLFVVVLVLGMVELFISGLWVGVIIVLFGFMLFQGEFDLVVGVYVVVIMVGLFGDWKGVMLMVGNILVGVVVLQVWLGNDVGDCWLFCLFLYHIVGLLLVW